MAARSDATVARTYGNWRRPQSAGLFGLGSLGTGIMMGGLVLVVLVTMLAGFLRGLVLFVLLAAALAAVAIKDKHGRSLLERTRTRVLWAGAKRRGAHLYRSGPLGFTAWGTHQLPGIAASLRLSEHSDAYGR
ncbi:MAG: SCO6880 family protein, partial [Candidatus Nanopelagicales bacterium]